MFRRRNSGNPQSQPEPTPPTNSTWNPAETRDALFKVLDNRLGKENGRVMREDFEKHIAVDPIHGVEQAYVCLLGKLIEYTDALNDQSALGSLLGGSTDPASTEIAGLNAFSVFRKER